MSELIDPPIHSAEFDASPLPSLRQPWPSWFPPVYVHSPYGFHNHNGARYCADNDVSHAKSAGADALDQDDAFEAAERAVARFIREDSLIGIKSNLCGRRTYVVSPVKDSYPVGNILAYHFAGIVAQELGLFLADGIFQQQSIKRDKDGNFYRRFSNPVTFCCDPERHISDVIETGADYIIADDVFTYGGTLCGLRTFIEQHGGRVICMTALAGMSEQFSRESLDGLSIPNRGRYVRGIFGSPPGEFPIAVSDTTLQGLERYNDKIPPGFFEELLGYGVECFTEREASYILQDVEKQGARFSLRSLRERILSKKRPPDAGKSEGEAG